jgi:hypothetical protein
VFGTFQVSDQCVSGVINEFIRDVKAFFGDF